jgi:hypothetical protein
LPRVFAVAVKNVETVEPSRDWRNVPTSGRSPT